MTIDHISAVLPDGQTGTVAVISGVTAGEVARLISLPYPIDSPMVFSVWLKAASTSSTAFSVLGKFSLHEVTTGWTRIYATNENPLFNNNGTPADLNVDIIPQTANYSIYLYKAQLEQGIIPSDWTVAPEDTDADITSTQTALEVVAGQVAANVTSINSLTGRMSAAEAKITDDAIIATVTSNTPYTTLEAAVSLVPGQISAAVNDVKIGGTNMIRMADGYVTILQGGQPCGEIQEDDTEHYYDISQMIIRVGPSDYSTTTSKIGFVRFLSEMPLKTNEQYTLSFWAWTSTGFPVVDQDATTNPDGNPRVVVQLYNTPGIIVPMPNGESNSIAVIRPGRTDPFHYVYTFTIADYPTGASTANLRFNVTTTWSTPDKYIYFSDVKLEAGNKMTSWSPYPDEMRSGAGFVINPKKLLFYGPVIDMEITDSEQEFHLDDQGAVLGTVTVRDSIAAPNIGERYVGSDTITVGAGGTYGSFGALMEALNNRILPFSLSVTVASNMYEDVSLAGIHGSGEIIITGTGYTLTGGLTQARNTCPVTIRNYTIAGSVGVYGGYTCFDGCAFNGVGKLTSSDTGYPTYNIYAAQGARIMMNQCSLDNANRLLWVSPTSDVCLTNLSGGNNTDNYLYMDGGTGRMAGDRPRGTFAANSSSAYIMVPTTPDSLSPNPPDPVTPPEPPKPIVTVTLNAIASGTYFTTQQVWDNYEPSYPNRMRQGCLNWNGVQPLCGVFWFDTSSLVNKTVLDATLTLTRITSGPASDVNVKVYTTEATSLKSVNPTSTAANETTLGTIGNGATTTYTLPTSFAQALVTNAGWGVMLNPGDTRLMNGRGYSQNYCRFAGYGETGVPVLSITYQET